LFLCLLFYVVVVVVVVVVAQDQKASGVRWNRNNVDRWACVLRSLVSCEHRHRRWNLYTVGSQSYPRSREGKGFVRVFGYVRAAADDNGVLLLKNCLRAETQGNYHK